MSHGFPNKAVRLQAMLGCSENKQQAFKRKKGCTEIFNETLSNWDKFKGLHSKSSKYKKNAHEKIFSTISGICAGAGSVQSQVMTTTVYNNHLQHLIGSMQLGLKQNDLQTPKASDQNVKFRSHCLKVKTECIQIIISLKQGQQHDLS